MSRMVRWDSTHSLYARRRHRCCLVWIAVPAALCQVHNPARLRQVLRVKLVCVSRGSSGDLRSSRGTTPPRPAGHGDPALQSHRGQLQLIVAPHDPVAGCEEGDVVGLVVQEGPGGPASRLESEGPQMGAGGGAPPRRGQVQPRGTSRSEECTGRSRRLAPRTFESK